MSGTIYLSRDEIAKNLARQACVIAVRRSRLPDKLKEETEKFIERNTLSDCGRVPPNCLKAFMIHTAQRKGFRGIIPRIKSLFRSKVGYDGYFLDSGKLLRIDTSNNSADLS